MLGAKKISFVVLISVLALIFLLPSASEEPYIQNVPEEGDEYFEMRSEGWISYVNPRDEWQPDSDAGGRGATGKFCVTTLNEDGKVITGNTIPDTTFKTNISGLDWHNHSTPFKIEFPLEQNYERPLDSDQLGYSEYLPQGNGYLDSHCIEWHDVEWKGAGYQNDTTISYTEPEIRGENSEDLKVKGYYESMGTWESDIVLEEKLLDYNSDEVEGGITYGYEGHGQIWIVLQLDRNRAEIIQERLRSLFSNSSSK